jgi:hypothetical protein
VVNVISMMPIPAPASVRTISGTTDGSGSRITAMIRSVVIRARTSDLSTLFIIRDRSVSLILVGETMP